VAVTTEQALLFALLILIFGFLIWGRVRYDLVAFSALILAFLAGLIPKEEVFLGFGHPAVIIIALVLIVSRGLSRSGAIEMLAQQLLKRDHGIRAHIGIMSGIGAALSTVMNNVAALALLMPVDIQAAKDMTAPWRKRSMWRKPWCLGVPGLPAVPRWKFACCTARA
jgi:di/tricarboxylate transporter